MRISKLVGIFSVITVLSPFVLSKTLSTGQVIPDPLPPDTIAARYWALADENPKLYRFVDSQVLREVSFENIDGWEYQYTIFSQDLKNLQEFKVTGKARRIRFRSSMQRGCGWGYTPSEYEISVFIGKSSDCTVRFEVSQQTLAYSTVNCGDNTANSHKNQGKLIRIINVKKKNLNSPGLTSENN